MLPAGEASFMARWGSDFRQMTLWCRLGSEKLRSDALDLRARFHGILMIQAGARGKSISSCEGGEGGLAQISNAFAPETGPGAPIRLRFGFSDSGCRSGAFQHKMSSIGISGENFVQ